MHGRGARAAAVSLLVCACAAKSPGPAQTPAPPAAAPASGTRAPLQVPDDPAAAIRFLEAHVARTPDDVGAWHELTSRLRRSQRWQEAARAGWQAVQLAPTWESWANLGNVFLQTYVVSSAEAAYEVAATRGADPDAAARNFLNLGYQHLIFGADELAARAIDRAEKASPANPQVHYDRAVLMAVRKRPPEARASARRALELLAPVREGKLPTEEARSSVQTMRALLERLAAGETDVPRPPAFEPMGSLPERFRTDPPGRALDVAIDDAAVRVYPVGGDRLFRIVAPTRWMGIARIEAEQTQVKLTSNDAPASTVLQITALVPPRKVDLREAAQRGADVVRRGGGIVEPAQAIEGVPGFWFWAADPNAKPGDPNDFPFLAQAFVDRDGVLLSMTLTVRADTPDNRKAIAALAKTTAVRLVIEAGR